ncbi:site-specific DNA-methyltransferase [Candidatus Pacearchaeota archaeon]|nr:site-specific DNA-methyltransferase [Candidatus Pacearchaeota archaeon]
MDMTYFIEEYKTTVPSKIDEWKVAFPEKVVERFIKNYSKKGDVVFDPFAGFGTTIKVAKKLGRKGFGTEIEKEPIDFAKKNFNVNLIKESAFDLDLNKHPKIDLCIFSPPYWGPALGAKTYSSYIKKVGDLVKKIKKRMNKDSHLIVLIQNYCTERGLLTLAWDVGNVIKKQIKFKQDIIWCIDRKNSKRDMMHEAADHHYCLIFKNE